MKPKAALSKLNGPAKSAERKNDEKKKPAGSGDVNDDAHRSDSAETASEKRDGK